jgi:hypothetical protein
MKVEAVMNEKSYFDSYWQAVARLLNCNPKQKTSAIRLSAPETPPIDGVALVRDLMAVMHGTRWREPASAQRRQLGLAVRTL